ncbi:MAG: HAD family phosphatase [Bacilli bacterium]|nr:HAD family phosphatase [Bacilli bacterium]
MYKMIVSDFSGTLINSDEAISVSTMLELDRVRKNGVIFCITTSKGIRVVKDYNRDFPFIDYIVAFNGSYIYDLNNDNVIYDKSISISNVKKIYKLFSSKDLCLYTLDYCNYMGSYKDKDYSELLIDGSSFIEENKRGIYKISIHVDSLKDAKNVVKEIKSNEIKVDCFIVEEDNHYIVEITNGSNSKLKAIEKISKLNKIKMSEVLAVCSSESSCSLVESVGCGCCVSNADKSVKKAANEITDSNEEKGVESIIKKYF